MITYNRKWEDALDAATYAASMFEKYPAAYVESKEVSAEGIKFNFKNFEYFKKEKNMNKKLYDVEYENEKSAILEKAKSEKDALDAKAEEALAKAEETHEQAKIKAQADAWASALHSLYSALVEQGFSEDIALDLIKIQVANMNK